MRAGQAWQDSGLAFTNEDGGALHPNIVTRWFLALAAEAGLRRIRFHGLRHSAIARMLKLGVPVAVVSQIAGHASTSFTMDVYAAFLPPDMQADAADKIASGRIG